MTKIEYADVSWNPVTGCTPISEGCAHCWAKRMAKRLAGRFGYPKDESECPVCHQIYERVKPFCPEHANAMLIRRSSFDVTLHPDKLDAPLHWCKPRRVFVCSMGDLFHEDVPLEWVWDVWNVMAKASQHTYLVLTKRPALMRYFVDLLFGGELSSSRILDHIWLGVTAENQKQANKRIPVLLETPAAKRWVSIEPCLGAVDLRDLPVNENTYVNAFTGRNRWTGAIMGFGTSTGPYLDWIVLGAETGPSARSMDLNWARTIRIQCQMANVPFFYKRGSDGSRLLDGLEWNEFPE